MNQLRVRITFGFLAALFSLFADLNTFAQINNPPNYPPYFFPSALFPASRPLNDVAYGNGTFVAIGGGDTILTSKDGVHWINHSSDFSIISNDCANINFSTEIYSAGGDRVTFLYVKRVETGADLETNRHSLLNYYYNRSPGAFVSVAFGRGIFVIVSAYGQSLTSRDCEHWTASELPRVTGKTTYLHGMTVGDAGFVAVGQLGMIFTSPDGLEWTQRESGTDAILLSVAYGNGTYVALADINSSYTLAITSKDGIKWTPADARFGRIESIAFGNGIFLGTMTFNNFPPQLVGKALGKWKSGSTVVSKDGINWSRVTDPLPAEGTGPFGAYFPTHLTFSGGRFIATSFGDISISTDANTWTPSANLKSVFYGATYGNGTFVAVGNGTIIAATNNVSPSSMTIVNSKDAVNWNDSKAPPSRLIWGYFANDTVFKLGYNFDLTSTNEASYAKKLLGTGDLIKYHFFAKGYDGNIESTNEYSLLESSDGETWTTRDKAAITGIVNGNRVIPYTDDPPTVLASEDGIHWHRIKPIHSDNPTPIVTTTRTSVVSGNTQTPPTSDNGVLINLNGQGYRLNLNSNIGQTMEIQASADLQAWETLTTITNTGGVVNFVDPDAKNFPQRFYRLKLQ